MAGSGESRKRQPVSEEKRAEIRALIERAMRDRDERRAAGPQPTSEELLAYVRSRSTITDEERQAAFDRAAAMPLPEEEWAEAQVAWEEFEQLAQKSIERERGVSRRSGAGRLAGG